MTVVEAVRDALLEPSPETSRDRVHEIVAKRLQDLARSTSVRTTGYFNHAWAPDLVVQSSDQPDRGVFLRFDVHEPTFADDLEFLAEGSSMFLDLQAANVETQNGSSARAVREGDDRFDLEAALAEHGEAPLLVTEIPAIERFDADVRRSRTRREAAEQVVVGGRGLVNDQVAAAISTNWDEAVEAVEQGEAEELREALDAVEAYLSRIAALDLETGLRARWIAAGQEAERFPGKEDWELGDRAPWEIARLVVSLLASEEAPTPERWSEITRVISASSLGHELYQLGKHHEGDRVTAMVRAGLPSWTAQHAYVPPLDSDSMERFYWSVGGYSLAVNLVSRIAYFTDIGNKWNRVPRNYNLPNAESRLDLLSSASVTGVGVVTSEEEMTHSLRPTASEPVADRLRQLLSSDGDPAWRAARIKSLELQVPGTSATAAIDFERSVVRTSDPVPLLPFAILCGRFVAGLTDEEIAELEATLTASTDSP